MTVDISAATMQALRPHLDADELSDEELKRISEETSIPFDELRLARDALWHRIGDPSDSGD